MFREIKDDLTSGRNTVVPFRSFARGGRSCDDMGFREGVDTNFGFINCNHIRQSVKGSHNQPASVTTMVKTYLHDSPAVQRLLTTACIFFFDRHDSHVFQSGIGTREG